MKLTWSKVGRKRTPIYCLTMYGFQEATYTDICTTSFRFIDGRNKKNPYNKLFTMAPWCVCVRVCRYTVSRMSPPTVPGIPLKEFVY